MEHERFAWLRHLSQLVVKMDEAMEEKPPITNERMDALVAELKHLLGGSEEQEPEPGSFAARYAKVRERDVAAADAEIEKGFLILGRMLGAGACERGRERGHFVRLSVLATRLCRPW